MSQVLDTVQEGGDGVANSADRKPDSMQATILRSAPETHSSPADEGLDFRSGLEKTEARVANYLNEIAIGVITGLISAWILELITNWALMSKLKVLFLFGLILITPLLIRAGLARLNISVSKGALVVLSILFIAGEATLFSWISDWPGPRSLDSGVRLTGVFAGDDSAYLHGSSDCKTCYTTLRVTKNEVRAVRTLHVLLEVEWEKRGKSPRLFRRYAGDLYYTVQTSVRGQTLLSNRLFSRDNGLDQGAAFWAI